MYNYRGISLIPIDMKYALILFSSDFDGNKAWFSVNNNIKETQEEGISFSFEKNYIRKINNIQITVLFWQKLGN